MTNTLILNHRRNIFNYILIFSLIVLTINPFFLTSKIREIFPLAILGFIYLKRGYKLDFKIILIVVLTVTLIIIQGLIWGYKILTIFTYVAYTIITPYLLFKIMGMRIFKYLANVIYFIAIYTLIIWALQNIFPLFDTMLQSFKDYIFNYSYDLWPRSIIFYTVSLYKVDLGLFEIYRNSGILHEPGGYAIWLIVGIGLNTIFSRNYFNKKNIVMVIALLSTFSTAGYIQLFVLMLFFILKSRMNSIFKIFIFLIFIIATFYTYTSADFLENKINTHISNQAYVKLQGTYTTGRIIRAYKMMNVITQSPIFGRGIITASQDLDKYSEFNMSGTASLKVLAQYGLFFGILFFFFFYKGIQILILENKFNKNFAKYFFVAMFLGGLSQDFYFDMFSIQFFFLGLFYLNYAKKWLQKDKNQNQILITQ